MYRSLHHWSDPCSVLNEIRRVLQPGGGFVIFDLRRDMVFPGSLLIYTVTRFIVPRVLRENNEPLGSRNAAYTLAEAEDILRGSGLRCGRVAAGAFWLSIEGYRLG
jgi:ubiquinone/menaquinone biosynthesis C-methylase UbiE